MHETILSGGIRTKSVSLKTLLACIIHNVINKLAHLILIVAKKGMHAPLSLRPDPTNLTVYSQVKLYSCLEVWLYRLGKERFQSECMVQYGLKLLQCQETAHTQTPKFRGRKLILPIKLTGYKNIPVA